MTVVRDILVVALEAVVEIVLGELKGVARRLLILTVDDGIDVLFQLVGNDGELITDKLSPLRTDRRLMVNEPVMLFTPMKNDEAIESLFVRSTRFVVIVEVEFISNDLEAPFETLTVLDTKAPLEKWADFVGMAPVISGVEE
ncbi:MAG: hypothetical protein M1834_001918 [Cirrosporium novae-zelandiae]|nr:MAG: hypothetical protein M1834_001918 [Cirrosporium novae-zelandiae]